MPKQRITKEMVVDAAFEIARRDGMEQVMVKNMEELRKDVIKKVSSFIREYVQIHIDKDDIFGSTGRAYMQLAKEELNLFKIFILHKRNGIASLDDLYQSETNPCTAGFISKNFNIHCPFNNYYAFKK